MSDIAYLDYAATTPCDPRVLEAMSPYSCNIFGNPNSMHHFGMVALDAVDAARIKIKTLVNADFEEVVFTSGATEANKIATIRTMKSLTRISGKQHFITLATEHKSVLDCADYLKREGCEVTLLEVGPDGLLDLNRLSSVVNDTTGLLSFCFVNNETGVIQDAKNIVKVCHERGILVHADATQAFGKIPLNVKELDLDFLSASGHKIYGPKGIGILYYKSMHSRLVRTPGANRDVEFGIRSGTVPVPLCVGMGEATEIASSELSQNLTHITALRERLIAGITGQLDEIYINGSSTHNYPGIVNMSFRGCEGEAIMMEAKHIAVSSGSACTSNKLTISHVLAAMQIPADIAQSSIRISIGKFTTEAEIDLAIDELVTATKKLRAISPVWDIIQSGSSVDDVFRRQGFR
ncbi:MAG: aminotransferase class V-fold PLP-dependent enzyme [Holosporales bacterium]|jgi:cysteine desulfurase|nr:aminotransferase class V-fold PLP-dependent enzyme [Holosporales bacterium]